MMTDDGPIYINVDDFVNRDELDAYATLDDVKKLIAETTLQDQERIDQLLSLLEETIKANMPIPKGFLREFIDLFPKIPGLNQLIGSLLVKYFLG